MIREDKTLDIYRFDIVGITIFVSMEKPGYICYNKWKIICYYLTLSGLILVIKQRTENEGKE